MNINHPLTVVMDMAMVNENLRNESLGRSHLNEKHTRGNPNATIGSGKPFETKVNPSELVKQ